MITYSNNYFNVFFIIRTFSEKYNYNKRNIFDWKNIFEYIYALFIPRLETYLTKKVVDWEAGLEYPALYVLVEKELNGFIQETSIIT